MLGFVYPADGTEAVPHTRRRLARHCRYTGLDGRPCDEPGYLSDQLVLDNLTAGGGR